MAWIKLDPITRRRFERFRKIKRGYYSLLILVGAIVLSIFAPYLAESRALIVLYNGHIYFPTFSYRTMAEFQSGAAGRLASGGFGSRLFPAAARMAARTRPLRPRAQRQAATPGNSMQNTRTGLIT